MQIQAECSSIPPQSHIVVISISAGGRGVWFLPIRVSLGPRTSAAPLTHTSYAVLNRCRDGGKRLALLCLYSYTTQVCMPDGQLHSQQKIIDSLDKPTGSQAAKAIVQWWIFFRIRHSECGFALGGFKQSVEAQIVLITLHACCMHVCVCVCVCGCVCACVCIFVCECSSRQRCIWACPMHMNGHSMGCIWWKIVSALTSHFMLNINAEWMKAIDFISLWDCPAGENRLPLTD